ncbi:MAG: dihydroorotate dehydrogenase (quinone), partial [Actinomycetes bacterium]
MRSAYERLVRPLLFRRAGGDPEVVHDQTLRLLGRLGELEPARRGVAALLARSGRPVRMAGIDF